MKLFKNKLLSYFAITASVLTLAGCSGEPSDGDVRKVITEDSDKVVAQLKESGYLPDNLVPTIHEVKKIGCAPAEGEAGYICDVESVVSTPVTGTVKAVEKYRFVKTDNGWVSLGKVE